MNKELKLLKGTWCDEPAATPLRDAQLAADGMVKYNAKSVAIDWVVDVDFAAAEKKVVGWFELPEEHNILIDWINGVKR